MGDHVGLGEIAGRAEPLLQLVEEAEVEIDLLVERTVERPGRGAGEPAAGLHLVAEEHHLRALVGPAGALELLRPEVLRVTLDEIDELDLLLLARASGHRVVPRPALRHLWEGAGRVGDVETAAATPARDEEEIDDGQDDQGPDPTAAEAAHRDRHAAATEPASLAAPILDVAAALARLPLHRRPLYPRPRGWKLTP